MKKAVLILLTFFLSQCYLAEPVVPDQRVWKYGYPDDFNLSSFRLLEMNAIIKAGDNNRYRNINSLLIIKDDHIVFENHYNQEKRREKTFLGYGTSSLAVAAIGILLEEGLIESLSDSIYQYLPEYASSFPENSIKRNITFIHLLTHRSGFSWNDGILSRTSPDNDVNRMKSQNDWTAFVINKPMEALPGTRFNFNSASALIIGRVVESVTGKNYDDFVNERIFKPLEIKDYLWQRDFTNRINAADGLYISMFDFAKIGKLFLEQGNWFESSLLSEDWTTQSTSTQVELSTFDVYGYYWRKFGDNFTYSNKIEENDVFFYFGESGNHLYIIPHKNMIVAIGANNLYSGFYNPSLFTYFDVINAL